MLAFNKIKTSLFVFILSVSLLMGPLVQAGANFCQPTRPGTIQNDAVTLVYKQGQWGASIANFFDIPVIEIGVKYSKVGGGFQIPDPFTGLLTNDFHCVPHSTLPDACILQIFVDLDPKDQLDPGYPVTFKMQAHDTIITDNDLTALGAPGFTMNDPVQVAQIGKYLNIDYGQTPPAIQGGWSNLVAAQVVQTGDPGAIINNQANAAVGTGYINLILQKKDNVFVATPVGTVFAFAYDGQGDCIHVGHAIRFLQES